MRQKRIDWADKARKAARNRSKSVRWQRDEGYAHDLARGRPGSRWQRWIGFVPAYLHALDGYMLQRNRQLDQNSLEMIQVGL